MNPQRICTEKLGEVEASILCDFGRESKVTFATLYEAMRADIVCEVCGAEPAVIARANVGAGQ